jgi:hypothetical protein
VVPRLRQGHENCEFGVASKFVGEVPTVQSSSATNGFEMRKCDAFGKKIDMKLTYRGFTVLRERTFGAVFSRCLQWLRRAAQGQRTAQAFQEVYFKLVSLIHDAVY